MTPFPISFVPPAQPIRLLIGAVLVDTVRRRATVGHETLPLTYAEYLLLETLALANGKPVHRDVLCMTALNRTLNRSGRKGRGTDRGVDQLVSNLRKKLPADRYGQPLIQMARCQGYWIAVGVAV